MKNIFLYTLLITSTLRTFSQEKSYALQEKISEVLVFRQQAQISSQASVDLAQGIAYITLQNLPSSIIPESIAVSGAGNFSILSVSPSVSYLQKPEQSSRAKSLTDSLNIYQDLLNEQEIKKFTLQQEQDLLLRNKLMTGKTDLVAEIEDMSVLYQNKLPILQQESYKVGKRILALNEKIKGLQAAFQQNNINTESIALEIMLEVPAAGNALLQLSYIVNEAGWNPVYDIRAKDIFSDLLIQQKAAVFQSTGVNWNGVKLKLSTGMPVANGNLPILSPQYAAFLLAMQAQSFNGSQRNINSLVQADAAMENMPMKNKEVQIVTTQLARVMEIADLVNLASNGQKKMLAIQESNGKAKYNYLAIPKISNQVYLVAKISDWPLLNLISGEANIYFEGGYVGQTYINEQSTQDSLLVLLGVDRGIVVQRERINSLSSSKTFGSSKTTVFSYQITLKNNKNVPVSLRIEDQIPIATDKSIEIKPLEWTAANMELESGKLSWNIDLAPLESKKINFSYEVKHPKNKMLTGLE